MCKILQLYKNIKTRRTELGLTQSELAKRMGYADKSMIAKIEKGYVNLTQSKILAFAQALNTTPADLMGWEQVDPYFSGKEASDEVYQKFAENIMRFHGNQKELNELYTQLSEHNQKKVLTYSRNLLSVQQMENALLPNAAHDMNPTEEQKKHADDIMKDDSFWD